jgi:hypothetical protein
MGRSGEEALSGVMVSVDAGVGEAGEAGDEVALWLEQVEVGARGCAGFWEEKLRHHAEGHVDSDEAARGGAVRG